MTRKQKKGFMEDIKKEFKNDRAKVTILPVSEFGLVEITRQRIRQNIIHTVSDICQMCKGSDTSIRNQLSLTGLKDG